MAKPDECRELCRDGIAILCVSDRPVQVFPQRPAAIGIVGLAPARHPAGHRQRGGEDAGEGHLLQFTGVEPFDAGPAGGAPTAGKVLHLPGTRIVNQPEGIPADPRHVRVQYGKYRAHRDGRVHRRAPALQRLHAGGGGQRVRGAHHSVRRECRRTTGVQAGWWHGV